MEYSFHVISPEQDGGDTLASLIETEGHKVRRFDGLLSYMNYFTSPEYKPPLAIVADDLLAESGGSDLIKLIRNRFPFQKIAIFSDAPADSQPDTSGRCFVLPKPIRPETLHMLILAMIACAIWCTPGVRCQARTMPEFGGAIVCPFAP